MKSVRIICIILFPIYLASCVTPQRVPGYLENVTDTTILSAIKAVEPTIQKNDLLLIQVYSVSIDPAADAPYNLPLPGNATNTLLAASGSGFLVDQNGNIEYPRIGTIHVEGLTKQQLGDVIKTKLTGPLTNPSVIVRFQNYKITIIGAVGQQGSFTIPTEKLTILEAMGLAGGVTEYGETEGVKVLREINGKREVGVIDLTSEKIFESPYYYLAQNDVVIVGTSDLKIKQTQKQETTQRIAFALSIITSVLFIYNTFR